jgi:type II secretory pathway pseudopilin PulG
MCWQLASMLSRRSAENPSHTRAFSLVEMIGVVAVVAIVAAVLTPAVIREMDQAARTKEVSDLNAISNAIVLQVLNTRSISNEAGMAQCVANWTRFPASRIATNNRRYARAFLIDTNGWFGTTAGGLPYTQTTMGSTSAPTNARVMILGSIAGALPVSTGRPGNSAFNDIWNTPDKAKPSTWTNWSGKGEDLLIQRVNLDQVFHRLVVVNRDTTASNPPWMTVGTIAAVPVAAGGGGLSGYYIDGSVVGLCDPTGTPMLRFALTKDTSYVFEGNVWYDQLSGGDSKEVMAQAFAALSAQFLASQWYSGSHQGGDQQGALVAMFNFMLVYGLWANQCPHFPWHSASSATQVPEYELLYDVGGNNQRLDEFTGGNGLLK